MSTRTQSRTTTTCQEDLAILGGERAVTTPLTEKWRQVDQNVKDAVNRLMDQDISTIANGEDVVGEFETAFAKMTGSRYALAMNSGTSTLHSAYFAAGVGPGDQVLVPTYTWHASITPVLHCAATPVFCDIDPYTLTIDPDQIERNITDKTKAICVVHVWGNVCDMDRILVIAQRHNLVVIEDCSHAHGATWQGRAVGSMGAIGCFSCQGPKPVSGGECGVAVTDDPDLFDRMLLLGHFGRKKIGADRAIHEIGDMSLGAKYRPHAWAVAMANESLKRLPESNARRTRNYALLNESLRGCPGLELVEPLPGAQRAGYLEFKFKLTQDLLRRVSRERIVAAIQAEGVPIAADRYSSFNYTYGLLHTAPLFTRFDRRSIGGCFYDPLDTDATRPAARLPVAEDIAARLISLHAYIDTDERALAESALAMRKVLENADQLIATAEKPA